MRAVVLIDGEHYAPVVRDALAALPYDVVAALLVGGTEKLRGGDDYGVPLVGALDEVEAEIVVDLSDEPVLGPRERFLWASRALALGLPYVGADFRFDPPPLHAVPFPSLAVIGTGKRVGKTAVATHAARLLARDRRVVVVSMGRGGPPEPELRETPPTVDDLVALARAGPSRRVRLPGDRGLLGCADGRLPPRGRRARGRDVRLERPRRRGARGDARSGARALRRERRRAAAGRRRRRGSSSRTAITTSATGSTRTACSSPTSSSTPAAPTTARCAR